MMRRLVVVGVIGMVLLFPTWLIPVRAQWSFELSQANNNWLFAHYGQWGDRGFFGRYDVDASSTLAFANVNGWLGNRGRDLGQTASGTNATYSDVNLEVNPTLGSDWVRLTGKYVITAYDSATSQGAYVAMSPTLLTTWCLDVDTPLGSLGYGKRDFNQALGLQFAKGRTSEYFLFEQSAPVPNLLGRLVSMGVLPRGVLSWFNPSAWPRMNVPKKEDQPAANGENGEEPAGQSEDIGPEWDESWPTTEPPYAYGEYGPGRLIVGFGIFPWQQTDPDLAQASWSPKDLNRARVHNYMGYIAYTSQDLTFGLGCLRFTFHEGPELQPDPDVRMYTPTRETYTTEGWIFAKYNNGRFFFNTELDWFNRIIRFQRTADGRVWDPNVPGPISGLYLDGSGRSRFAPLYNESWRFASEWGMFFGPSAVRFFYAYMPGPDRRHGILIDRQPFIQEPAQAAYGIFEPYSVILGYQFGSGVEAPAYFNSASVYGVKLDYALAANLFVQGTILRATRNSDGYGLGYIRPSIGTDPGRFGTVNYGVRGSFTAPPPSIPEKDLGWEFTLGCTWELVQKWVIDARFAYWRPGRWFNHACIDRSVLNWDVPVTGNNWGTNPDRKIDPLICFEIRVGASY